VSTLALKTTSDTLSLVALDKFVSNLYAAIKVVDLVFTAGDVGSVFEQVLSSNNYNIWDVRAMGVTLIMVPPSQTITNPSQSVPFSVTVNGGPTSSPGSGSRSRYYNWSCGPYGTLSDGKTQGSSIVASLSQAVTYSLVGTTLPTSPDKVEVTVFDPSGLEMGTVSGIVKFAPGATVNVALTQPWTDSGLSAAPGQQLTVNTTGTMDYWTGGCPSTQNCNVTPDGLPWSFCSGYSPTFAEPGLSCYSLVGRIGASGAPFEVGSSFTYTVPTGVSGELFLGVNDNNFVDNSGSWTATVAVH
jgi:hypothetical protein